MREPASILHRTAALALLACMIAIAVFFVVKPIRQLLSDQDKRLVDNAVMIHRLSAGNGAIETYSDALAAAEQALNADLRYLSADSPALASAALQQIVRQALEEAGATLRSIQDTQASTVVIEERHDLSQTPVTVRATVIATYPEFLAAVAVIENSEPYLFVDRLSIRAAERAGESFEWPALTVRFDVTAFMPPSVTLQQ